MFNIWEKQPAAKREREREINIYKNLNAYGQKNNNKFTRILSFCLSLWRTITATHNLAAGGGGWVGGNGAQVNSKKSPLIVGLLWLELEIGKKVSEDYSCIY